MAVYKRGQRRRESVTNVADGRKKPLTLAENRLRIPLIGSSDSIF